MYSIGQLNGINGGSPDLNKLALNINSIEVSDYSPGLLKVSYTASLFISWPSEIDYPKFYQLILPIRGSNEFLRKFTANFGNSDHSKRCLARSAHDVTSGNFWYYYRPNSSYCPLTGLANAKNELGNKGRVILRYSGTESLARVMVEGEDLELVDKICNELVDVVANELN